MTTRVKFSAAAIMFAGLLVACTSPAAPDAVTSTASIENSCINPTEISKQTIVSDQEIRFELKNGEVWANHLPRVCPSLKRQGGFSWQIHGTLACSNQETIYVREDGTPCPLGEFSRLPPTAN